MSKSSRAVIDQPGLKIILSGVVMALFLGFGFKSQITTQKVSQRIRQIVQEINLSSTLDFETAEVKLSDWGIPKPYVVVNQLRLKNPGSTCGQSQIYVEKLIVPLTFDLIFNPRKAVFSLRLNRVEARIGNPNGCFSKPGPPPAFVDHGLQKDQVITKSQTSLKNQVVQKNQTVGGHDSNAENALSEQDQQARIQTVKTWILNLRSEVSTELSSLRIDFVKVIFEDQLHKNFELRNVTVQFDYQKNRLEKILLQSQMVGLYDTHSNSFKLRSDISSELNLTDEAFNSQLTLKGKIIDRDFSATAIADSQKGSLQMTSYLKSMPLKTFFELARGGDAATFAKTSGDSATYKFSLDHNLNFNLTGEVAAEFDFFKNQWLKIDLDNAVIKSADSSIELNHFDYLKWTTDEKYRIQFVIVQFDLNNFYRLFKLIDMKWTIDSLGVFSGTLEVSKNSEAQLNGILRNMSVVFSTKNKIKLQKITSMNVKSSLSKSVFQLRLSDISMEENKIIGQIEIRIPYDAEKKKFDLDPNSLVFAASLKGKILSPEIEQHMFFHEQDYDLGLKLVNTPGGRQVLLTAEEFLFSNLQFKKINFFIDLDTQYKPLSYRLSAKTLTFVESENEGSENDYVNLMETYLKELKVEFPVVIQNFEMKYNLGIKLGAVAASVQNEEPTLLDQYSMVVNTVSSPKSILQFRQTGKLNSTSVWQIENVLKTSNGEVSTTKFLLNSGQGTFEKVE